jgi:hypothetical protein
MSVACKFSIAYNKAKKGRDTGQHFSIDVSGTVFHELFMDNERMSKLVFAFITYNLIEEGYFNEDWKP